MAALPPPHAEPLTRDLRSTLHLALLASSGEVPAAARLLEVAPDVVNWWMRKDSALAAYWMHTPPTDETTARVVPDVRDLALADEAPDVAGELLKEIEDAGKGKQLRNWEQLGITDPVKLAMARRFQGFARKNLLAVMDGALGGAAYTQVNVADRFDKLTEWIEKADMYRNNGNKELSPTDEQYELYFRQWLECADLLRRFNVDITKTVHMRASIQSKLTRRTGRKNGTPGWRSGEEKVVDSEEGEDDSAHA